MIIAICGLQGSGKDTLGNIFVEKYNFKKLSFAGILKDVVALIFNWSREMLDGLTIESRLWREQVDEWWSKKLNIPNLTPRYILQHIGTDLFRNHFDINIWIYALEKQLDLYQNIVITDCRFPNEIEMLKNKNALLIKIIRGQVPSWYKLYEQYNIIPSDIHPSEYMWINQTFNYTIENNGAIHDLENYINFNITV